MIEITENTGTVQRTPAMIEVTEDTGTVHCVYTRYELGHRAHRFCTAAMIEVTEHTGSVQLP